MTFKLSINQSLLTCSSEIEHGLGWPGYWPCAFIWGLCCTPGLVKTISSPTACIYCEWACSTVR